MHAKSFSRLALPKSQILAFLDGRIAGPLQPTRVPLNAPELQELPGYEGLEAIAFAGDQVYATVETDAGTAMLGYLLGGQVQEGSGVIVLDVARRVELSPQTSLDNFADEALIVMGDGAVLTLYEANGVNVNPAPIARRFAADLTPLSALSFPNIEYRITDATGVDENGRFWASNYLFPGDLNKLDRALDPLAAQYGRGPTHRLAAAVERLVEFQVLPDGIALTGRPPIQLQLAGVLSARNWEGIVHLDDRGFLLVTDTFPETILGFVAVEAGR